MMAWRSLAVAVALVAITAAGANAEVVGGRPKGCPSRFCGCALSLKLFGAIRPQLNLAANWMRVFPQSRPAPGMVAARRGHVFMLKQHVKGKTWLVWDANSGGGKIRVHQRSIAGYVIVDPHGSHMAETRDDTRSRPMWR